MQGYANLLLNHTTKFASAAVFQAYTATPTLAWMKQFDALLVWSDVGFANASILGDRLAQYCDEGGSVVGANFIYDLGIRHPGGRWVPSYFVIQPLNQNNNWVTI